MKIAFVTDAYNYGRGGDVATIRMAEGLKKRGHVISVVAAKSVQAERFFQVKGFYPPLTKEAFTKGDYIWGVPQKKVLRKAFADVDLIQVQHPFVLGYGAVKVAQAMGKPVIGSFHVQPQNILGMMGLQGRFKERCLEKLFLFLMFNRVPFLQCPSQFAADLMKKMAARVPSGLFQMESLPSLCPRTRHGQSGLAISWCFSVLHAMPPKNGRS